VIARRIEPSFARLVKSRRMKSTYASAVAATAHARLTAMPVSNGPSIGGLVNRPFQERNAKLGSARRTATGIGSTWDASCIPSPPKAASSNPIGDRPKMTDASNPIAAKARIGASTQSQASRSFPAASAGDSRWPSRPVSGRLPTTSPPARPETASPGTHIRRTVRLASDLAMKIRRGERTATSR
jgi:hypothetical protein